MVMICGDKDRGMCWIEKQWTINEIISFNRRRSNGEQLKTIGDKLEN